MPQNLKDFRSCPASFPVHCAYRRHLEPGTHQCAQLQSRRRRTVPWGGQGDLGKKHPSGWSARQICYCGFLKHMHIYFSLLAPFYAWLVFIKGAKKHCWWTGIFFVHSTCDWETMATFGETPAFSQCLPYKNGNLYKELWEFTQQPRLETLCHLLHKLMFTQRTFQNSTPGLRV